MALPARWYFGGKNRDGNLSKRPYGGFNLGGINPSPPPVQSSVATPNPASAGVSGQPAGGMRVGWRPDDGTGADGPSTPAGNANVTGPNSALLGTFANVASLGVPGLGGVVGPAVAQIGGPVAGMVASILAGLGVNAGKNAALGTIPSGLSTTGSMTGHSGTAIPAGTPVTYSGNTLGLPTGSLIANVPSPAVPSVAQPDGSKISQQGLSVEVPSVSPNMGFGVGVPGSTSLGPTGVNTPHGHVAGVPMSLVPAFPDPPQIPFVSPRASDPVDPVVPTIPDNTFPDLPAVPNYPDIPSNFPDVPTEPDPPTDTGVTGNDGNTSSGDTSGGPPGGSAGGVDGGQAAKHGGLITKGGVKRPDPHRLSKMLKAGAKVNVGDHDDETDDVPVVLTRGEIVMNPPASRAHGNQLTKWNEQGRRAMGGMGVGPSSPRSTGAGGRSGGFAVGRPLDERR